MAYAFTGLFDSSGSMNNIVQSIFNLESSSIFFPSIRNITGCIIIFSFTLYPYVYLIAQTAFINQSRDIFDTGRTLGLSKKGNFLKTWVTISETRYYRWTNGSCDGNNFRFWSGRAFCDSHLYHRNF